MMNNKKKAFKLIKLRRYKGYSQQQLALESGISKRCIEDLEQGVKNINNASVNTLRKLAAVLGCNIEDLIE